MKKLILLFSLILLIASLLGCTADDPIAEDLYTTGKIYQWDETEWQELVTLDCVSAPDYFVGGNSTAGYWVKNSNGQLVRSTSDGYADDDIQWIISQMTNYREAIQLTTGIFVFNQAVVLPDIDVYADGGFVLRGNGEGVTIIYGGSNGAIVHTTGVTSHIAIEAFSVRGYYCEQPAIYLKDVYYSTLRDITVRNTGELVTPVRPDGIVFENCNTIDVYNLHSFLNQRWGAYLGGSSEYANAIRFYGCVFQWNGQGGTGGGINVYVGTANLFSGCTVEGNVGDGIGILFEYVTQANSISGASYFEANSGSDIVIMGTARKNTIDNCYSNGSSVTNYFIHLLTGDNITISNVYSINHTIKGCLIDASAVDTVLFANEFSDGVTNNGTDTHTLP